MKENIKKSAVDLTDLAIGLVILGIAVTIGSTILLSVRDSRLTELPVITTTNEQVIPTKAGVALENVWFKDITSVYNATGDLSIDSGNYTVTVSEVGGSATFANTTLGSQPTYADLWNVTYTTWDTTQADFDVADKAAIGLGEYGNWFKIIAIVGIAAVILSLIFLAFGKSSGGGDLGGSY